jgi:hypothetical protein
MNLREGDRLAAIAILEPSTNGNGDDGSLGEGSASVEDSVEDEEEPDEEALAALPTQAEVDASDEADEEDDEDEELVVDTDDDAKE